MADVLIYGDTVRSAEMRHEVALLVPDRPGFGGSSSPPVGSWFADVAAYLLTPVRSFGVERFGIVTQSGGTAAHSGRPWVKIATVG